MHYFEGIDSRQLSTKISTSSYFLLYFKVTVKINFVILVHFITSFRERHTKLTVFFIITLCCIYSVAQEQLWPKFRLKKNKIRRNISYERRVYESVDDKKNLSWDISQNQ